MGHVFISYVREDSSQVDRLQRLLDEAGILVWRDTSDLSPGEDWRVKIGDAITDDALVFIACFSRSSMARAKSYQNEELLLAVEQLRLRRPGLPWLIPVRFDDCEIPELDIGGGRTLSSIHRADLFADRFDDAAARLVAVIRRIFSQFAAGSVGGDSSIRRRGLAFDDHGLSGGLSQAPVCPVWLVPRPAMLAGREGLLAELHARMTQQAHSGPQIIALYGLGGCGKTSVAVEYAHRHQIASGLTWQFPAEEPVVLAAEFARLAALVGAAGSADRRDPVAVVHAWLARSAWPWLLIFDNASDQEAVRMFLPPAGEGQVLITSQSALWPHGQGMEVPVLDNESAAEFLIARTGSADRQAAAGLADELGGLPLALEQAGAYVVGSGASLADYLRKFQECRAAVLGRGEPTGYGKTVASTWGLAFAKLENEAPAAVGLLRLLSCCASEPVPLKLLLQRPAPSGIEADVACHLLPLIGDMLTAADAVAALRKYSLVSLAGDGLVVVHRLVQAVTVDQMPADVANAWHRATATLIQAAIPSDATSPEKLPVLRSLLPHAQAVLPDHSPGLARITNYLGRCGSYRAARDLYQRITVARERVLGAEHQDTVTARHDLAHWTGLAGDAAAARDKFAELLPVSRRVFGPEHRHSLTTCHSLGYWTGEAGDAAAARDQLAKLLLVRQRVLGRDDPDTLNSLHDLARWTGEAGDPAAARDQLAELLPAMEGLLGPEHPDTLNSRHDLARWTGEAGDPAAARDQLAELLPAMERLLGPEHPDTLNSRHDLARWTGEAGDPAAARDQLAELLPAMERLLGLQHPATWTARDSLAHWTTHVGATC